MRLQWLWLICLCPLAQAEAEAPVEVLIRQLSPVVSFSASFSQETTDSRGRIMARDTGEILVSRPNKLRWHLAPPREQVLVSDGDTLWFYDPDLEQVTVRKGLTSIDRVPALLLAGEVSTLRDDFKVEMVGDESKRSFRLLPKKGSSEFREIRLKFINGEVHQLALLDAMGQQIVVEFGELLINSGYDPGAFTFQVPPGVDVLEDY